MKRAFVIDTVLVVLLSALALQVGSELALKALRAITAQFVVDGPDVLGRFQQRFSWACAFTPLMGWGALLPLHLKGTPTLMRRLTTLLLPLIAAAGATAFEVQRLHAALAEASSLMPLVSVDSVPLARTVLLAAVLVAAPLLGLNSRTLADV